MLEQLCLPGIDEDKYPRMIMIINNEEEETDGKASVDLSQMHLGI